MNYRGLAKRALDVVVSAAGMVALSPVFLLVTVLVLVTLGRPILFVQRRAGLRGMPFRLVKFRTMTERRDGAGALLPDDQRLPSIGRFLRASSLDELPTLWNVLCGHMSLVGPRPLHLRYLDRYSDEQARRHEVRPGVTGWAQVNGRNALTWEEKFAHDVWYVDHVSPWLDIKILAMTAWQVVRRRGISAMGHATMPEFMGTNAPGESGEG